MEAAIPALPSSALAAAVDTAHVVARVRSGLTSAALRRVLDAQGAHCVGTIDGVDAVVVTTADAHGPELVRALRRSGLFRSVEMDARVQVADDAPNDPLYGMQWALPRIAASAAWDITRGAGVQVAVIDTGVDASHPDLLGQVAPGYDFVNDDADPQDDHGHGTRMSGIIAARRNNAEGIAGIAPDAVVLPVKVLDATGYGAYSAVASGIVYAVDHGARVLNLSLAGPGLSDVMQAAVDYATAHDAVVVAAAGNFGSTQRMYPAAAAGAVSVGAVDEFDAHPAFSDSGDWLSIAAPGVDIATTSLGASYTTSTGTSPAAAVASGVFALVLAANPVLTRGDAIDRVQRGAIDLGARGWDPYFGWGCVDAYGALVPGATTTPAPDENPPVVSILSPIKNSLIWGQVAVDADAHDDVGVARVELFVDNRSYATAAAPPYQFTVDAAAFEPGTHRLRADAYDAAGNYARSKTVKVVFTPGAGLLVTHAVARPSSVTIRAVFALPPDAGFDPAHDGVAISLTSADGTVLAATAQAGAFSESGATGRVVQGTIAPAVPSAGRVQFTARTRAPQPLYAVTIKASRLSPMHAAGVLMNLGLAIGTNQLSQSLTFRPRAAAWVYP